MAQDIIHQYGTADEVARAVADAFITYTQARIAKTGTCVVAVSGGTTPNALFELLNSDAYMERVDWENIYFLWVDERFVSQSSPDNNFYRAKTRLFSHIGGSCHFYPVPTNSGTVEEAAEVYEKEVKTVLQACEKDHLDLALLGLGDDGHTASLFPSSEALHEKNRLVTYVKDGKVWDRVTMTFPFLAAADDVWFTVVGDTKRAALTKVLRQRKDYADDSWESRVGHVLPGAVLSHDTVEWFVDKDAH